MIYLFFGKLKISLTVFHIKPKILRETSGKDTKTYLSNYKIFINLIIPKNDKTGF